ncbi:MAG: DUF126 domain-containing protein [Desulfobacteraceae bacterium]|nr:DUF126 domain-containing protein [Desulfobacteraceae bacterium]
MGFTLKGQPASAGMAEGQVLACRKPFMFLSYVDMASGLVYAAGHEIEGENVKDKVIVAPCGCGSTDEESSLCWLKEAGVAPKALIIGSALYTPGIVGAILADIPMIYGLNEDELRMIETGDHVTVNANTGVIEVTKREA